MENKIIRAVKNHKFDILNLFISTAVFIVLLRLNYTLFKGLHFNGYVYLHFVVFILSCYFTFRLFKENKTKTILNRAINKIIISLVEAIILYYLVPYLIYQIYFFVAASVAIIML